MKYIHPPGPNEVLIARGTYAHLKDGERTGTEEHWEIHELKDLHLIRTDDGTGTLIQAHQAADGRIVWAEVQAVGGADDPIQQLTARYMISGKRFRARVRADDADPDRYDMVLPPDYVFTPESLIFAGMKVLALALLGGEVASISYFPTLMNDYAFRPISYMQQAQAIHTEDADVFGTVQPVTEYVLRNPRNSDESRLWADRYGVLLRYIGGDGVHGAELIDYERHSS